MGVEFYGCAGQFSGVERVDSAFSCLFVMGRLESRLCATFGRRKDVAAGRTLVAV